MNALLAFLGLLLMNVLLTWVTMGGLKPILEVEDNNLVAFSTAQMKAKVSLYQESVQCRVNLFLAAF